MTTSLSPKAAESRLTGRIGPTHLERLAIVYVRQSTPQQIERNQESTRLQYALVERATQLGWSAGQVVVIDDESTRNCGRWLRLRQRGVEADHRWRAWPDTRW